MSPPLSRRAFLATGAAAAGAGAGAGFGIGRQMADRNTIDPEVSPPRRQHAWNDALALDEHGNHVLPPYHRLVHFTIASRPSRADAESLEGTLRDLQRIPATDSQRVLCTLGWGASYFERHTTIPTPVADAEPLSSFQTPNLDRYDACLHVTGGDDEELDALIEALAEGTGPLASQIRRTPPVLEVAEVRAGFVGQGIPAERQAVGGIPERRPVAVDAPLFMGFRSGFRRNQATEDDITIETGLFTGGTTMHVSRMRLRLDSWYDLLDDNQRAARMFSPMTQNADVTRLENEAPTHADELPQSAQSEGVIGHLQATATARKDNRPLILRRDFNTTDDGQAGLHFVSLQRSVEDFNSTRRAMNAAATATESAGIDARTNNGINEFIFVTNRANYLIPPSPLRAFPYLDS